MQFTTIQRILGLLLLVFSTTMIPPIAISWLYKDSAITSFVAGFVIIFLLGLLSWFPVRHCQRELRIRDGFVVVVLFWTVLGIAGALPLVLATQPNMTFTNAVFESISGLTTTGATVITRIDELPKSILFYRQLLQWLGGMGIVVLAVAVLPMLGVGGMQLYRAETPGPMKDTKLTPRIKETAKALWYIYLGLTTACAGAYWWAGMSLFDAISHSFSTVAIGGFSTHELSIGYFDSRAIELVAVVFMLLAGMNFALHFVAWRSKSLVPYASDPEAKTYITVLWVIATITVVGLYVTKIFPQPIEAFHHGIFQAVSIATTTGFTTTQYHTWPGFLPVLLLFSSFIGGCAGSTAGGMKVVRFLLLIKQVGREFTRLVHPSAQIPVKVGEKILSDRVMDAVWGFFSVYVATFSLLLLLLMVLGLDQVTAFSALAACLNNLGPGLGEVGSNYAGLGDAAKWVLCVAMLLGRLEIFTLLVLLTPIFWRR